MIFLLNFAVNVCKISVVDLVVAKHGTIVLLFLSTTTTMIGATAMEVLGGGERCKRGRWIRERYGVLLKINVLFIF